MSKNICKSLPLLKTIWRELFYRPTWYSDSQDDFERLFLWSDDPWNFQSSRYEKDRLEFLLQIINNYPCDSILEVGCAEGIFTTHLQNIARQVVAIDISPTALSRARQRCPGTSFSQKDLRDFTSITRFDLVICSETLYYMKDVAEAIDKLTSLGKRCVVSYIHREAKNLDPYFRQMPLTEYKQFKKSYWLWKRAMSVVVWENNGSPFYFKNLNGVPRT